MTKQEKIELAENQIKQAEIMLEVSRKDVIMWENLYDIRVEYLAKLKDKDEPSKTKLR